MALCGKWELTYSDNNFADYMKAAGVSEENQRLAQQTLMGEAKLYQVISKTGDTWTIRTVTEQGERDLIATLGISTPWVTLDGRSVTVTLTEEGASLMEEVKGEGFTARHVRSTSGDTMTMHESQSFFSDHRDGVVVCRNHDDWWSDVCEEVQESGMNIIQYQPRPWTMTSHLALRTQHISKGGRGEGWDGEKT